MKTTEELWIEATKICQALFLGDFTSIYEFQALTQELNALAMELKNRQRGEPQPERN